MDNPISSKSEQWFEKHPGGSASVARLFCIPHAGGSGYFYRGWRRHLPETLELFGVRLPGRGPRSSELPYRRMDALVTALSDAIVEHLDRPFIVFGHSMGALIGFELCTRLEQRGFQASHLIVSATRAPHISRDEKLLHALPRDSLVEEVSKLNGTPSEFFADESIISTFLPVIRSDLELVETYPVRTYPPLTCPITAFGGESDETVTQAQLEGWSRCSTNSFRALMFPGGHFYILDHLDRVLRAMCDSFKVEF